MKGQDLLEAVASPERPHKEGIEGVRQQGGGQVGQQQGAQLRLTRHQHGELKAVLPVHEGPLQ